MFWRTHKIYNLQLISIYRYYLAALHYNENSDRLQAVTADGQPRYAIRFRKFNKGDYTTAVEKTAPTYGKYHGHHQQA